MKGVAVALLLAAVAAAANECPSDWTQELLLEHPDCNKFYKCTYGQPVELDCWSGLYFNIDTWECDWPANVDCGDRNVPGQEPDPEPETEAPEPETEAPEPETEAPEPETEAPEPETEAPEPETEAPEPETEAPEPETEAPEPETEAPEPETEAPEPETEAPEPETEAPEPETEAPELETEAPEPETEAPEPETEAPEPDSEFQDNGCPVDHSIHWLLPAEDDCNGFYYCVWGERVRRACPPTLHFNREIQVCDWPANAGCVSSFNKHSEARFAQGF